jgi:hypothetical protein
MSAAVGDQQQCELVAKRRARHPIGLPYPGVAGMLVQIGHGGGGGPLMGGLDRFFGNVVGQRA